MASGCLNRKSRLLVENKAICSLSLPAPLYHTPAQTPAPQACWTTRSPRIGHAFVLASSWAHGTFYPVPHMFGKFLVLSDSSVSALKPLLTLSGRRDHSNLCAASKLCARCFFCPVTPCWKDVLVCKLLEGRDHFLPHHPFLSTRLARSRHSRNG